MLIVLTRQARMISERRCKITEHLLPGVCMHVYHECPEQFLPSLPEEEEIEALYALQSVVNKCFPPEEANQIFTNFKTYLIVITYS